MDDRRMYRFAAVSPPNVQQNTVPFAGRRVGGRGASDACREPHPAVKQCSSIALECIISPRFATRAKFKGTNADESDLRWLLRLALVILRTRRAAGRSEIRAHLGIIWMLYELTLSGPHSRHQTIRSCHAEGKSGNTLWSLIFDLWSVPDQDRDT